MPYRVPRLCGDKLCDSDQLSLRQDSLRMIKQRSLMVKGTHEDGTENRLV